MKNLDILYIEDDTADFYLTEEKFKRILGNHNYHVEWAQSYQEGLEKIQEGNHAAYLVDYTLGAKNGLDLIRESVASGYTGPFILLTGMDNKDVYKQASEDGAFFYVLKDELSPSALDRSVTYAIDRWNVEKRLNEEKAFNAFIMEKLPYIVIAAKPDGTINFANREACDVTKYSEEELLEKNLSILFSKDQYDALIKKISSTDDSGFYVPLLNKDYEKLVVKWDVLKKPGSKDDEFILSGKDVTSDMEAESQERQKEKMEALGHLAGGVAHEINNLLQPIMLASEIIQSSLDDDDKRHKHLEKIIRSSTAAADIVDEILSFSRQEKKEKDLMDVSGAVDDTLRLVKDMLPGDVKIGREKDENVSGKKGYINKSDMMSVLSNLLINAAHAMGETGQVFVRQSLVNLGEDNNIPELSKGQYIKIDVCDSGEGISEENMQTIFNPFFTTKEVGLGTGLGLPICYNVLQSWEGTIKVESTVGEGTTFSLYIPVSS